ncbi:MAG: sigma-70 family RNA polymerase sigma factor [Bacteroidota bacterium]
MQAVVDIWKTFDKALYDLICKRVNHHDHCHDILQEVYIKVIQNIDKVENASNTKSYLLRVADNAVVDYYRQCSNKPNKELEEDLLLTEETVLADKSLQLADCCLRPMIESLEPIYKEALIMTELEGLTQQQYADKIGISTSNAKIRVHRAKQKLKEVIQSCCTYYFDSYGNVVDSEKKPGNCCGN